MQNSVLSYDYKVDSDCIHTLFSLSFCKEDFPEFSPSLQGALCCHVSINSNN